MGTTIALNCAKGHVNINDRPDGVGSNVDEPSPMNFGTPARNFSTRSAQDHVS